VKKEARPRSDLAGIRFISGSYQSYRKPTSSGQRCEEKVTLLTVFDLFRISCRIYLHSQVHIKKNHRYNVIHCLLQTLFLHILQFLGICFLSRPISNPLCPSTHLVIQRDAFGIFLTPMIGRATEEGLLSLADQF
jgi:hypothetical protein